MADKSPVRPRFLFEYEDGIRGTGGSVKEPDNGVDDYGDEETVRFSALAGSSQETLRRARRWPGMACGLENQRICIAHSYRIDKFPYRLLVQVVFIVFIFGMFG